MNFVKLFLMVVMITNSIYSQTLFENTLNKSNTTPLNVNKNSVKNVKSVKQSKVTRLFSTNLESVILRGDIHFLYEIPDSELWSTLLFAHFNPQSTFQNETGDFGVFYGRRMYHDILGSSMPTFIQGMIGFNHYTSWDLFISFEFGQRFKLMQTMFFDISMVINRSYSNDALDPMAYIKANFSFSLDQPLFYFF